MKKSILFLCVLLVLGAGVYILTRSAGVRVSERTHQEEEGAFLKYADMVTPDDLLATPRRPKPKTTISTPPTLTSFSDTFSTTQALQETSSPTLSSSPRWWVNSGAYLYSGSNKGSTILGELASSDQWYTEYANTNPGDTDQGAHPQNIFRLVQKDTWKNFSQEVYYTIRGLHLSASSNRNASNGLFLFNRYQNGDNLYYVGLRVDGNAVIKKKYNGTYYTMASTSVFSGTYNRDTNPNLLPLDTPIGIRSVVTNTPEGNVNIKMYTDVGKTGVWKLTLETTDTPGTYGSALIPGAGFAGIRTDFLDAVFENYSISEF